MKGFIAVLIVLFAGQALAGLRFSPSYHDFGDVSVDRSFGSSWTFYLYNNTDETMSVSISDNCFTAFFVSNSCFSLRPYGSCTVRAEFRPRREGLYSCRIQANGNYSAYASASLRGRGVEDRSLEVNEPYSEE